MQQPPPSPAASLLPLLVLGFFWGIFLIFIAHRKGINKALAFILGFLPFVNIFWSFYLVSLTDIEVRNKLKKLQE